MTPSTPVLVLGASGTVGHHVAPRLLAAGQPVRVVGRSVARLRDLFGDEVDAVRFDLRDAGSWPAAFAGVDRMFVLRPPEVGNVRREVALVRDADQRVLRAQRADDLGRRRQERNYARPCPHPSPFLNSSLA